MFTKEDFDKMIDKLEFDEKLLNGNILFEALEDNRESEDSGCWITQSMNEIDEYDNFHMISNGIGNEMMEMYKFGYACLLIAYGISKSNEFDKAPICELMNYGASILSNSKYYKYFAKLLKSATSYTFYFNDVDENIYVSNFNRYIDKLIPNAKIVEHKNLKEYRPDSWVELDGELIPVEAKLDKFNEKALKQLNRYVKVYNCKRGIAIGRELTVKLPKDYIFISTEQIKEKFLADESNYEE